MSKEGNEGEEIPKSESCFVHMLPFYFIFAHGLIFVINCHRMQVYCFIYNSNGNVSPRRHKRSKHNTSIPIGKTKYKPKKGIWRHSKRLYT